MVTFTVWFWISSLWALDPEQHQTASILLSKYLLVYYMVYRVVDTPARVTEFLLAHVAGCLFLGITAYFTPAPGGRLDGVGGPGIDDANALAMYLATGVCAAGMLAIHLAGWRKYLCIVAIVFAMNGIVLAGSRGAFLALAVGGAMLALLRPSTYQRQFRVYGALAFLIFGFVASEQFWERMRSVEVAMAGQEDKLDVSARSRIELVKAQWEMAKLYPFGTGHRGTEVLSDKYLDQIYMTAAGSRSSHNAFMTVLVEQGIPGLILLVMLVAWVSWQLVAFLGLRKRPTHAEICVHAAAIGSVLTVVLVAGVFADFSKCEVQIWMFALLSTVAAQRIGATTEVRAGAGRGRLAHVAAS